MRWPPSEGPRAWAPQSEASKGCSFVFRTSFGTPTARFVAAPLAFGADTIFIINTPHKWIGRRRRCTSYSSGLRIRMSFSEIDLVPYLAQSKPIGHNYIGHNYIDHVYTGHSYTDHNYTGHNCIGHNYIDHNYTDHNYIGHNYKATTI